MYDYLIDYALKNIWCTPNQDKQAILKPVRLTPKGGSWNSVMIVNDTIKLPKQSVRFHVYQIGQLHPLLLGLFPSFRKWKLISENCSEQSMICDVYDESGIQYPRFQTWYMVTKNKNLIVAVQQPRINTLPLDFYDAKIYIRVYSNEFFNSHRASLNNNFVYMGGKYVGNAQDIVNLQNEFITYQSYIGSVYAFVNGYRVKELSPLTVKVGDLAEYVYDSTIKAIYDFKIRDLKTFVSILDQTRKYLLHYPGQTNVIDYQDDIDIFLIKKEPSGQFKGVYHHKNQEMALRNLTHKDYSVSVDIIEAFGQYRPEWTDLNDITVRLHIRHSGYDRSLVYVSNRIHELYKLNEDDLVGAMLGIDSNVPVFKAENLENSAYTEIMRAESSCLGKDLVQDAFGYNSISQILANTPKKTRIESGIKVVDVNYGLIPKSTAYEYDNEGILLGFHNHTATSVYIVQNQATDLVEQITNHSSEKLEEYYQQTTVNINPENDYRFYLCGLLNGNPDNRWVDVTGSGQYAINNNVVTWFNDQMTTYNLVRGDQYNLGYEIELPVTRGLLKFSITSIVNKSGVDTQEPMKIPMGRLDLFLNGKLMIEDLDYFVHFPDVVICNKEYLINPETENQKITVRFVGHCNEDLEYEKKWDTGFIDHGLLSNNNRFDLRDDKVLSISVGGSLYMREELQYAEEDSGVTVPDVKNGSPYLIRDIIPDISIYVNKPQDELRAQSELIDKEVSDFLTIKIPGPSFPNPNIITDYYRIYSPFFSRVMDDLLNDVIDDPRIKQQYSDADVMDILSSYEYLLDFDPTTPANSPDDRYVIIDPYHLNHVVDVNIYQYKFLEKTLRIYCNNKFNLNHVLRLIPF